MYVLVNLVIEWLGALLEALLVLTVLLEWE